MERVHQIDLYHLVHYLFHHQSVHYHHINNHQIIVYCVVIRMVIWFLQQMDFGSISDVVSYSEVLSITFKEVFLLKTPTIRSSHTYGRLFSLCYLRVSAWVC